jgi:hypothetical protein
VNKDTHRVPSVMKTGQPAVNQSTGHSFFKIFCDFILFFLHLFLSFIEGFCCVLFCLLFSAVTSA